MIPAVSPLATEPLAADGGDVGAPSAFTTLVLAHDQPGQYLVEIEAFQGSDIRFGAGAFLAGEPLAAWPLAATPGLDDPGGSLIALRFADIDWTGTPEDADQPNVYYEGRVFIPLEVERLIPTGPEVPPRIQRQFGALELVNADGALDSIVEGYAIDGRLVTVRYGPLMGAYADFKVIGELLALGWEANDTIARIPLQDRSFALEQPFQTTLYAGTGGAEGNAEVKGKPKPWSYGRQRNIRPLLIDPTNLVFQWHDGQAHAVDDVFERGLALTRDTGVGSNGDVADYAALIGASITANQYATSNAAGLFRLASTPAGLITADVRGHAAGGYLDTIDQVCLHLLRDLAGLGEAQLNAGSFAGLAGIGGELGIYISAEERPSFAEVLDRLVASAGGFWGGDRLGKVRAGRLARPEETAPVFFFDDTHIVRLDPDAPPLPRFRQRVAYQPNWTQQRGEDLAPAVTAARRQFLTETERAVTASDNAIRTRHPEALDPPALQSLYETSTDAQALADELLALHKRDRRTIRITTKRLGYLFDLGQVVQVTWPRLGLEQGRRFVITGVIENARADESILQLWG